MAEVSLIIKLIPLLDAERFTRITTAMKSTMESMGAKVSPIDEAKFNSALRTIQVESKKTAAEFEGLGSAGKNAGERAGKGLHDGIVPQLHKTKTAIGDVFKTAIGFAGGAALFGGAQGIFGGLESILEAGKNYLLITEQMELGFRQAGLAGEGLEKQMVSTGAFAKKLGFDFAVPIGRIKELSAVAAGVGGAFGKTNEDVVQLAIGVEKASKGLVSGEMAIRVFTRGITDPEGMANLGRLKMQFPALATALKGITDPALMAATAMKTLGPTFETLREQAKGPLGSMERFEMSFKALKTSVGAGIVQGLTPVFVFIGEKVVPAIQSVATQVGPAFQFMVSALKPFAPAIIAAAVGFGIYTFATSAAMAATIAFGAAMLVNPVFLAIAGITALAVGVKLLSDKYYQSAESKLKDTQESIKNIEEQKKLNQESQETEKVNISLIAKYEALIAKRDKLKKAGKDTSAVEIELNNVMGELNNTYPSTINLTGDHAKNLEKVKNEMGLSGVETKKFTKHNQDLVIEYGRLSKKAEELGGASKLTAKEQRELKETQVELKKEFPGVIEGAENTAIAFNKLEIGAGLVDKRIKGLRVEISEFEIDLARLREKELSIQIEKQYESEAANVSHKLAFKQYCADLENIGIEHAGKMETVYKKDNQGRYIASLEWVKGAKKTKAEIEQNFTEVYNTYKQGIKGFQDYNALIAAALAMTPKIKEKKLRFIVETELKTKTTGGVEPTPTGDEKSKIKSYKDEIAKYEDDLEKKKGDLLLNTIDDQYKKELQASKNDTENKLNELKRKYDEIKSKTDINETERTQYLKDVQIDKELIAKSGEDKIHEIDVKYTKQAIETQKKKADDILNSEIDLIQKKIALQETYQPNLQGDNYTKALVVTGNLRLELLKKQNEKEIAELLSKNEQYQKQQQLLWKMQAEGGSPDAIKTQQEAVNKARADAIANDPSILTAYQALNLNIEKLNRESDDKIKLAKINSIQDTAIRSREIAIFEAEKQYREELQKAQGNQSVMLDAERDFTLKKAQIEEDYLNRTSALYRAASQYQLDIAVACQEVLIQKKDELAIKDLESQRSANEKEVIDLRTSLQKKEISSKEYFKRVTELHKEHNKIAADLAKANAGTQVKFWDIMKKAVGATFTVMVTDGQTAINKMIKNQMTLQKSLIKVEKDGSGNSQTIKDQLVQNDAEMRDQMMLNAGAMFAQMGIMEGNWAKAAWNTAFESTKAYVSMMAFKAMATTSADYPFPLNLIMAPLAYAAVMALMSAIQSIQPFATGGLISGKKKLIQVNEEGEEFIVNATTTKRIAKDLTYINTENTTIEEHIRIHRQDLVQKFYSEALGYGVWGLGS